MRYLKNLDYANRNNWLWPPVADAVDTFMRRRACNADSYERIWRLIHVWEALDVTLASIALSRYIEERKEEDKTYQKCREYFYGLSWDEVNQEFKSFTGASNGSIDQWLNILVAVSKDSEIEHGYLLALKEFLNSENINLRSLAQSWSKSCNVPSDVESKDKFKVIAAQKHINTFRNRFAHVPFPHDPLDELAEALEDVTEQLFSISPLPSQVTQKGESSPLTGAIIKGTSFLKGTIFESNNPSTSEITLVFPCSTEQGDHWAANDFVYVDGMMRPHIMARFERDETNRCQYIRFKAEANAILIRDTKITENFPKPKNADYKENTETTFANAIDALKQEDFDTAINFFDDLSKQKPSYHIAWLNLGYAQREKAVRLNDKGQAIELLRSSTDNLEKASKHIDSEYQARALYEKSKAHYQIAKRKNEQDRLQQLEFAHEDAEKAEAISSDPKYQSWLDYLNQDRIRENY